jgi:hypothetical protein
MNICCIVKVDDRDMLMLGQLGAESLPCTKGHICTSNKIIADAPADQQPCAPRLSAYVDVIARLRRAQ